MTEPIERPMFGIRRDLIIMDFKTHTDLFLNDKDRINSFRQWEITVFAAVLGLALSQSNIKQYLLLLVGVFIAFALLEVVNRARMELRKHICLEIEKMIMKRDDEYILKNFIFANERWASIPIRRKLGFVFINLVSP